MFNSFKFLVTAITCCAYLLASKTKLGRRQGDTDSPRESSAPRHQNKAVPAGIWSDFPFNSDPDIFLLPSEEPCFCPMICQETPQDFVLLQALTHLGTDPEKCNQQKKREQTWENTVLNSPNTFFLFMYKKRITLSLNCIIIPLFLDPIN